VSHSLGTEASDGLLVPAPCDRSVWSIVGMITPFNKAFVTDILSDLCVFSCTDYKN
jgi:hypothetical protein